MATRRPRSRMITLDDGRRMHARVWKGSGTPIVLLHGLLDSADGWRELCRGTRRPCVAFDLSGFGASDMPARASLDAYAADVAEALDVLVPGDWTLVGHSLGGGVAAALAELRPERTRALVLLAPAGFGRIRLAELISLPGVRTIAARMLPFALGNRLAVGTAYRTVVANGLAPSDELLTRVLDKAGALVPGAVEGTKAVVHAGVSERCFARRGCAYTGPVTAIWGDGDRLVPVAHAEGVARAFPHVEAHVWPGMGHHPQCERPQELAEAIEAACARASGAPAALPAVA